MSNTLPHRAAMTHYLSSGSSGRSPKRFRRDSFQNSLSSYPSASVGSNAFSKQVKQQTIKLNGGADCWHCWATPIDICPVIGIKDRSFPALVEAGMITFDDLMDLQNAIALCPLCHRNFDDLDRPGFVFIPEDLEYFRSFEVADFNRRQAIFAETGTITRRLSPTAEQYLRHQIHNGCVGEGACGGRYLRYTLHKYFPKFMDDTCIPGLGPSTHPQSWHGAPMASLRHIFKLVGQPVLDGIPQETLDCLLQLVSLYNRKLTVVGTAQGASTGQEEEPASGGGQPSSRNDGPGAGNLGIDDNQTNRSLSENVAPSERIPEEVHEDPITVDEIFDEDVEEYRRTSVQQERLWQLTSKTLPDGRLRRKPVLPPGGGSWKWGPASTSKEKAYVEACSLRYYGKCGCARPRLE